MPAGTVAPMRSVAGRSISDAGPVFSRSAPVAWFVVAVALLVACGTAGEASPDRGGRRSGEETGTGVKPYGSYAVGMTRRMFVDTSRSTPAHGGSPERPDRTLPSLVLYPSRGSTSAAPLEDATPVERRWPLVVFSHGSTRSGIDYLRTLSVWVSAGYVVVAPDFPLSHTGVPGGTDYTESPAQARDVAFVIDRVTELAAGLDDPVLSGRLVPGAVGVAGQSFGAMTSLLAGFATCCAVPGVGAVVSFAGGAVLDAASGTLDAGAASRPLLSIHGTSDPTLAYAGEHDAWNALHGDKFFLTLHGGGHDDGFFGGTSTPRDTVVALASLGFLDRYLKDDARGIDRMRAAVAAAGPSTATLERS